MGVPCQVFPYTFDKLIDLFEEVSQACNGYVRTKGHCNYFKTYFEKVGPKTILKEGDYLDRDYLEDFAGYYVRCFEEYSHRCTRLHFFTSSFEEADIKNLLSDKPSKVSEATLRESYLGFMVLKPLPQTFIGRTCLKTYPADGTRSFPINRQYSANLFGIPLSVDSLAFQEQDQTAAACATSALWSAFHGTGILFQHSIPSPVEITKSAATRVSIQTRNLPNSGLTLMQMADAVRNVGLEPLTVSAKDLHVCKGTIYAYLRGKIPVLLAGQMIDRDSPDKPNPLGRHAVVTTGFNLGIDEPIPYKNGFLLDATRLDKLYVHDDQVGPFARMEFMSDLHFPPKWGIPSWALSSSYKSTEKVCASLENLMIPCYHKIRIPFERIHDLIFTLDTTIKSILSKLSMPPLVWDIHLSSVADFKRSILQDTSLNKERKVFLLLKSLPKFLWIVTVSVQKKRRLLLAFDATDIPQGSLLVDGLSYDKDFSEIMALFAPALKKAHTSKPMDKIFDWLANPANH